MFPKPILLKLKSIKYYGPKELNYTANKLFFSFFILNIRELVGSAEVWTKSQCEEKSTCTPAMQVEKIS